MIWYSADGRELQFATPWADVVTQFSVPPSNKQRNTGIPPALNQTSIDRHLSWKYANLFFPHQACRGNSPFFYQFQLSKKNLNSSQKQQSMAQIQNY